METFVARYPELVKDAITAATNKIYQQTVVRDSAAKKVEELRAIDTTSSYTSIGSNAGQAEIAYNIEEARLCHEIEQLGLIREWADTYLEYIKNYSDSYNFSNIKTFWDFYTTVNKNHIERFIRGHRFECKCQFFGYPANTERHFYINGDVCCSFCVPVHLSDITSAVKNIGIISQKNPDYFNLYPIPNNFAN
jgi:hypothetical protein